MGRRSREAIQRSYYSETANRYDEMHLAAGDEHYISLSYISALLRRIDARTVLDVGCGTGRASLYLREDNAEIAVYGIEPVAELLDVAVKKGANANSLVNGTGLDLPFKNSSFDAVIECGVLHHVREPERVVNEMMRVARKAVFLSDSNIFGQGKASVRVLKLALYKLGLWKLAKLIQTGGTGCMVSDGDGLAYSYSTYFQYGRLAEWAHTVVTVPVRQNDDSRRRWSPVLTADTVLLCALRE